MSDFSGVGCHISHQGVFPTQGLNPSLMHCRQILYHLREKRSPVLSFVEAKTKDLYPNSCLFVFFRMISLVNPFGSNLKVNLECFQFFWNLTSSIASTIFRVTLFPTVSWKTPLTVHLLSHAFAFHLSYIKLHRPEAETLILVPVMYQQNAFRRKG